MALTNELTHFSPYIQSFSVTVTTAGTPVTVAHSPFHKFVMIAAIPVESGTAINFTQPTCSLGSFTIDADVSSSSGTIYCQAVAP